MHIYIYYIIYIYIYYQKFVKKNNIRYITIINYIIIVMNYYIFLKLPI